MKSIFKSPSIDWKVVAELVSKKLKREIHPQTCYRVYVKNIKSDAIETAIKDVLSEANVKA